MLELERVDAFYGAAHILHALSLEVKSGEAVALLGRNGAGKSTTLRTIMGLLRARRGRIRYDGTDITTKPTHEIARLGLGYVPEDRRIFADLTVEENLEVGRRRGWSGKAEWTPERLYALFPNLAERRKLPGGRMSGGEQQMLAVARTLMGNPRLILLDEPSEGIAPIVVEDMARAAGELKRAGLSILLSEQNLRFARAVADRAVIIETGAIRWNGTFAEFDTDPEIGRAYLAV